MISTNKFLTSVLGAVILSASLPTAAYVNNDTFGVVAIASERSTDITSKDYGVIHCVSIEFQKSDRSLVIVHGKSDQGFSGGMIYETDAKNGSSVLFSPNSFWGGILHHIEPSQDDAIIQVRIAVASLCQGALYNEKS